VSTLQGDAQSCGAGRDGGRPDCRYEETFFVKACRHEQSVTIRTYDNRDDVAFGFAYVYAESLESFAEVSGVLRELFPAGRLVFYYFNGSEGSGTVGDGGRGRVYKASGLIYEQVNQELSSGDYAAACGYGLAHCDDNHINFVEDAELLCEAGPGFAETSESMCLIDNQDGIVFFLDLHECAEVGGISIHREYAFGYDEPALEIGASEELVKSIQVFSAVCSKVRRGAGGGIYNRGVCKLVEQQ